METSNLPKSIQKLIDAFSKLPGVGPKTAQRLTFHLLHFPREEVAKFSEALLGLKDNIKLCTICKNVSEDDICLNCSKNSKDKRLIAVVSGPLDALALERSGFRGVYHVLHGLIDPLNNIGPDDIFIQDLTDRVTKLMTPEKASAADSEVTPEFYMETENQSSTIPQSLSDPQTQAQASPVEIVLATNMGMEGESTSLYISKILKENVPYPELLKITRIARGLPAGGDIEYADDITLLRALEGRQTF